MTWQAPGRATVVVIHEQNGDVYQFTRGEDDASEAIWVSSDQASITTAELLDGLTRSLQAPYVAPDVGDVKLSAFSPSPRSAAGGRTSPVTKPTPVQL